MHCMSALRGLGEPRCAPCCCGCTLAGMAPSTPTTRRRLLGQALRQLRTGAGITPADAAKALGVTTSSLSRIETGKQAIKEPYVRVIASMTNVNDDRLADLIILCEQAAQPEWYHALASSSPTWFRQYLGLESAASEIRIYSVELVPGLLQTEDYARAVMATQPDGAARDLDGAVKLRQGRQARLLGEDPPRLHAVINQLALVANVGGPAVMRAQCEQLLDFAGREHITLQVLPFGAGAHPAMTGAPGFNLLDFDGRDEMPTVVYIDAGRGALYPDAPADLVQYRWTFDQLVDLALSPDDSRALLATVGV